MDKTALREMIKLHESSLTVRTYECDMYGHVNNAVYLNYLEYARMEYLHSKKITLESLKRDGFLVVVVNINVHYHAPAFPGDTLKLELYVKEIHNTSGVFLQKIYKHGSENPVCTADVTWVFTDVSGRPVKIPEFFREELSR